MEKNRVKFYSTSDFVYGYMVNKAIDVLKVLDENVDSYSLDDILELYNINKYAENTLFPKDFPTTDQKYFDEAHKKKINKIISIYVSKLNDGNIERITQDLHGQYNEDFWGVIVKYKVYNRISNKTFKKILPRFNLLGILAYKSLVSKYDYNISEYEEYQKKSIMHLVDKKIIQINERGFLSFVNFGEVAVLCDLYYNGFASVSYYRKHNMMNLIETLQQKDWIFFSGELLASPKSDYFNYYLNKSDFSNGFDLRNKYLHGTQRKKGSDDELHKMNYYTLLMLYVIIVIKINEEFCERSGDFD